MLTLAFDTSSKTAAVAILRNSDILYDAISNTGLNHSEILLPSIDYACRQTGIKINDFDLFVCTVGPGAFTGLRVSISTLKGLLLAVCKPAVGVSSLAALAMNINGTDSMICPVINAGRGQVYASYYRCNDRDLIDEIGQERITSPEEILSNCNEDIIFIGDGAIKYQDLITKKTGKAKLASDRQQFIRASSVAFLGEEKFNRNELINPDSLVPVYLRPANAKPGKRLFEKY
jgi:tRNA threonylcarbamoyladenosine biosynthesis protein TsaB